MNCVQALAYLYQQSTYVIPIVGVQTVEHVRAMGDGTKVMLSDEEIAEIHRVSTFVPLFPISFLYQSELRPYSTRLGAADVENTRMAGWIDAPPKQPVSLLSGSFTCSVHRESRC